jgi:hypothetical protein
MERTPEAPSKKSYQPPKLQIYGNLVEMTKGGPKSTMSDSGMNSMS